ncbi:Uncharacterised protein [Klebsiella pneumoniae]|nr:Uncharacterised protein [Klebsiella pneumoniae]
MADGARRVQPLRTHTDAVHNAVTAEYAESIAQAVQALAGFGIATVDQEPIRGQQASRADELVRVPPERRARGRTAGAQNTLVQPVEFLTLLRHLQMLASRRILPIIQQVRLNLLILCIELPHVHHQITDNR